MSKRAIMILPWLMALAGSASAQSLTFEVSEGEAIVNFSGQADMTALQFCLHLPEGVTADTGSPVLGSATNGHKLCVETLPGGDFLFILYSMDLNALHDGELFRFPITLSQTAEDASLYVVRYADAAAVSHEGKDVVTGIDAVRNSDIENQNRGGAIYNVAGQRLSTEQRGIVIKDGRKVLK